MGDRISIQFENDGNKSVVLFSHWGGKDFLNEAIEYIKKLKKERKGTVEPLDRFEPQTVMVDFIRHLTKNEERITSNYYFGFDEDDGDNSDNGHFCIDLIKINIKFHTEKNWNSL